MSADSVASAAWPSEKLPPFSSPTSRCNGRPRTPHGDMILANACKCLCLAGGDSDHESWAVLSGSGSAPWGINPVEIPRAKGAPRSRASSQAPSHAPGPLNKVSPSSPVMRPVTPQAEMGPCNFFGPIGTDQPCQSAPPQSAPTPSSSQPPGPSTQPPQFAPGPSTQQPRPSLLQGPAHPTPPTSRQLLVQWLQWLQWLQWHLSRTLQAACHSQATPRSQPLVHLQWGLTRSSS